MRCLEFLNVMKGKTLLVVAMSVFGAAACGGDNTPAAGPPLPAVTVMEVEKTNVDVFREYPARIHGSRQAQVRAMVQGILIKKLYEEGQVVGRDTILFLIDPEPYEIELRRARAGYADASANHGNALREKERYDSLYDQKVVSAQERERVDTQYELARARLELAAAAVAEAQRNLRHTEVRAPLAGVTDMESVSEGNLIEWGRLLTTITQTDPVHVIFSLPEKDAMTQRLAISRDAAGIRHREAELLLTDGSKFDVKGEIDFTASTIDSRTGTVTARAVFSNPAGILVPGQFVRIRVLLGELEGVFLIDEKAISQGREGTRVFVVDEDGIARERTIRTGPALEGLQVVIEGLEKGDPVVVLGHVALRDGMKVSIDRVLKDSRDTAGIRFSEEVR
ncbi:MAG: efflux RND transporter periplasmic adaptor subunit [Syntrophales bacterium]|nr:efflux RND transporter periplasmic adaptor subunit [Syntrophales bacterium]